MQISDNPSRRDLHKILIVRLGSMGDVIHALPAVAALRQAFSGLQIGWVIEERWVELLCAPSATLSGPVSPQRPLVDHVHAVNTFRWRSRMFSLVTRNEIREVKRALRTSQYDAVVDFQGALKSAVISRWAKAPAIYGFAAPREKIARRFYSEKVPTSGTHVIQQNFSLAEFFAQQKLIMTPPLLPRDSTAESKMEVWLKNHRVSKFVLINPGAGWGAKQWPAEKYGHVARQLSSEGFGCLVNFGPAEEPLAKAVQQASGNTAQPMSCSITELIALTRRANLSIGGDTGPMHLAAAMGVPVVAIFGPTDPDRNGPFTDRKIVLRNAASATSYSHHNNPDDGLAKVSVEEVLDAAHKLLGGNP
jgi:heptosyltransferase I